MFFNLRFLQLLFLLLFVGCTQQRATVRSEYGKPDTELPAASSPETGRSTVDSITGKDTGVIENSTETAKSRVDTLSIAGGDAITEKAGGEEEEDDFGDDLEDEFEEAEENSVYDPFEGYNRFMTGVNDGIYVYAIDPLTGAYRSAVPKGGRRTIGNFFHNLLYPVRLTSNLLQAKFKNSGTETLRFLINSTVGLLGLFDPASAWFGLERKNEDLGQVLGFWGVGSGPHIVLPVLGPSNLRDIVGSYPTSMADVTYKIKHPEKGFVLRGIRRINSYSLENMTYSDIRKGTLDLYLFLRDAYEQNRNKKIRE